MSAPALARSCSERREFVASSAATPPVQLHDVNPVWLHVSADEKCARACGLVLPHQADPCAVSSIVCMQYEKPVRHVLEWNARVCLTCACHKRTVCWFGLGWLTVDAACPQPTRGRYLLLEDLETGDMLMPLIYMKVRSHGPLPLASITSQS